MNEIKDLELTLHLIPKMSKYDAFGKPTEGGEYCAIHGEWLTAVLTELKERREATPPRPPDS